MKRMCKCGSCEYCSAYTSYQMDLEFGYRRPRTGRQGRIVNMMHHMDEEERCREFGTAGTTLEQRRKKFGEMPQGTDLIDALGN